MDRILTPLWWPRRTVRAMVERGAERLECGEGAARTVYEASTATERPSAGSAREQTTSPMRGRHKERLSAPVVNDSCSDSPTTLSRARQFSPRSPFGRSRVRAPRTLHSVAMSGLVGRLQAALGDAYRNGRG